VRSNSAGHRWGVILAGSDETRLQPLTGLHAATIGRAVLSVRRWNTFVMIGKVAAFLGMIRNTAPVLFETFRSTLPHGGLGPDDPGMQVIYDTMAPSDFSEVLAVSTERLRVASCGEVGWSDLGEPGRFIAALVKSGSENPWAVADTCTRCGVTHEQIVTLSGQEKSNASLHETALHGSSLCSR